MRCAARVVMTALLLFVAICCLFGFLAAREDWSGFWPFALGYGMVGVAALIGAAGLWYKLKEAK